MNTGLTRVIMFTKIVSVSAGVTMDMGIDKKYRCHVIKHYNMEVSFDPRSTDSIKDGVRMAIRRGMASDISWNHMIGLYPDIYLWPYYLQPSKCRIRRAYGMYKKLAMEVIVEMRLIRP